MQIIVLGMHRAGTSLSTRIINMMGAYCGPESMLLETSKDNPKGFWERKDVLHINRTLLQQNSCSWYRVDRWDDSNITTPPPIKRDISKTLSEMNAHRPWVMKDPRMCITLPCWLSELTAPVAVIASRHPLEIARSLELRNAMPLEYGLALWEYHAAATIRHAHALPKVFTTYESMLENPAQATRELCDALGDHVQGLHLPAQSDILDFVTPSLKRASKPAGTLSAHQQALYSMLLGETPFTADIGVSTEAKQTMQRLGNTVTGAPVSS